MLLLVDIAFALFALVTMPVWLTALWWNGKLRSDWPARLGLRRPVVALGPRRADMPRILLHAVSVGEVQAVAPLAELLRTHAEVVVSVTTDTGIVRARQRLTDIPVVRFPFDFSWAMRGLLSAVQPDVVVLAELELWPNCTALCVQRGIRVGVVNGRLSPRSFRRYLRVRWLLRPMFRRLSFVAAQDRAYADRFVAMGVDPTRVKVTGTMKWDSAASGGVQGADALATALGIDRSKPLIVAGSTAPGEEAMLHAACPPGVQLLCAPRKPEWFAQAATAMPACVRRSERREGRSDAPASGRFLLDTIGELRAAYSLADVVVIGRSFGVLHGSDMMEPAALGKPVVVGPRVGDFQSTADALLAGDAMVQVNAAGLADAIRALLADPARREQLAENASAVIAREQGATARNAAYIRAALQDYSLRREGRR